MPQPRTPDAFMVPDGFCGHAGSDRRANRLVAELSGPLGGKPWFRQDIQSQSLFANVDLAITRCYPVGHPLQYQDRFDWFLCEKQGEHYVPTRPIDGHPAEAGRLWVGYLKEDPHADIPAEQLDAALDALIEEHKATPLYQANLQRIMTEGTQDHGL